MADLISPLEDRRSRKRKRDNNPPTFSDTDDSLCMDKPRKRLKTTTLKEIDLCSSDSENHNTNNIPTKKKKKKKKKKKHKNKNKNKKNDNKVNKCFICDKSLRSLSPTRQELHINSCLDMNERDKNYTYSLNYSCPVCHIDLTIYDQPTRTKHMNKCCIDAKKNNDDLEFENNIQLEQLDAKHQKQKELSKNIIITSELKNIFEHKFVCFMCSKSLNRYKLKGRCSHLKQCAKKQGKDIYSICSLIGIDKNIIDNPDKYEHKFNKYYYKNKNKNKKTQIDNIDDLNLFAFGNNNEILIDNNGLKERKKNIQYELNEFIKKQNNQKKIGVNDYDKYIQNILNALSEVNGMIQKMEQIRQHFEIKLQRAQNLKKQHENDIAEQEAILMSVSPNKCIQTPPQMNVKSQGDIGINVIRFKQSSVDKYNCDLLASQRANRRNGLWTVAQETHKISPSQFNVSNVLPIGNKVNEEYVMEGESQTLTCNNTQLLLDGLLSDDSNNDNELVSDNGNDELNSKENMSGEFNSESIDNKFDISILEQDNELILNVDQNSTFPNDLNLSLNESFFNSSSNNNIVNDVSMHSNNGSLFEVECNMTPIENNNNNKQGNITPIGFKNMIGIEDNNMSPIANISSISMGNNVTPIAKNILPMTPMIGHVPITPMVGSDKKKILKALNLYFETPETERIKAVQLPADIPGRKEYINMINKMSLDELKKEMKKYGLKCGSKLMMKQRLEMVWDSLHPNSPMIRVLNKYINGNKNKNKNNKNNKNKNNEKKNKKKTRIEIEQDIINLIYKNDNLLLKISTFNTIKYEEIDNICKQNDIKISKMNLQKFLDEQGISFVLPEDNNAVKGPRRPFRKRKK